MTSGETSNASCRIAQGAAQRRFVDRTSDPRCVRPRATIFALAGFVAICLLLAASSPVRACWCWDAGRCSGCQLCPRVLYGEASGSSLGAPGDPFEGGLSLPGIGGPDENGYIAVYWGSPACKHCFFKEGGGDGWYGAVGKTVTAAVYYSESGGYRLVGNGYRIILYH